MSCRSIGALFGLLALVAPRISADEVPLRNWTVPSSPTRLSALGDIGTPGVFVAVTPCRVVDTRAGMGFGGTYGPPALAPAAARTFNIVASGCTGLPANVSAFSLNFTVTNTSGPGHIIVWPAGATMPNVSTLNYLGGQTLANAAISFLEEPTGRAAVVRRIRRQLLDRRIQRSQGNRVFVVLVFDFLVFRVFQ